MTFSFDFFLFIGHQRAIPLFIQFFNPHRKVNLFRMSPRVQARDVLSGGVG